MSSNHYYNYGTKHSRKGSRRRGAAAIPDVLIAIVTLVVSAAMLLSFTAQWIHPEKAGLLPVLCLVIPVLYIIETALLLYWTIRWKKLAFLPLCVLAVGLFGLNGFFKPEFGRTYSEPPRDKSAFTVMTYNVMGIMHRENNKLYSSMDTVAGIIASERPDILCIQEFQSTAEAPKERFDELLDWLPYSTTAYKRETSTNRGWGVAIYSRYPILKTGVIDYDGTSNSSKWADIRIDNDTVRVFCSHLQTTAISTSDHDFITNMDFVTDSTRSEKLGSIYNKLQQNFSIRARQADSLSQHIAASPHPVVVCGDFNDTPMSYVYHTMSRGLKDGFKQAGHGMQSTYRGFFDMLRIDYILHSPEMQTVRYDVPDFDVSDHNPVVADIKFVKGKSK